MISLRIDHPRFPLGTLVITPNAESQLQEGDVIGALQRHAHGNWGDLEEEDRQLNDQAVVEGTRILSAYVSQAGVRFWIITEADRSVTTILLPEDY